MQRPVVKIDQINPRYLQGVELHNVATDLFRSGQSRRESYTHVLAKARGSTVLVENLCANRHT